MLLLGSRNMGKFGLPHSSKYFFICEEKIQRFPEISLQLRV